jgi:hypothetical protein
LKQRDCTFIHVSGGGLSPLQQIPAAPGFQVPFADCILKEGGLPTIAVGLITEAQQVEDIVVCFTVIYGTRIYWMRIYRGLWFSDTVYSQVYRTTNVCFHVNGGW